MIKISTRLVCMSHTPGIIVLLPGSRLELQLFPTLIRVREVGGTAWKEIPVPRKGPIHPFTVEQDLEHGCVRMFGKSHEGFFSLLLKCQRDGLVIKSDRGASHEIVVPLGGQVPVQKPLERLFLGSHRALLWERVRERSDMHEVLPLIHRLALWTPAERDEMHGGTRDLLDLAIEARRKHDKVKLAEHLKQLFWCAFEGMLVPRLSDPCHLGIVTTEGKGSPLYLLAQSGALVRSLFFEDEMDGRGVELLPCLLPTFAAGRFMGLKAAKDAHFNLEWSGGSLRTVEIEGPPQALLLHLPKGVHRFRARRSSKEKGKVIKRGDVIDLDGKLFLDRFEN